MKIATVGLDLAKNVFQLHGVDADGRVATRPNDRPRASIQRLGVALEMVTQPGSRT